MAHEKWRTNCRRFDDLRIREEFPKETSKLDLFPHFQGFARPTQLTIMPMKCAELKYLIDVAIHCMLGHTFIQWTKWISFWPNPTSPEICFSQPKRSKGTSATSDLYQYFLGQLRKCDNFCQNLTWGMTISLNFAWGWRDRTDQFLVDLSLLSLDFLPTHQSQLLMKHETDHAEIRGRHKNWKEKTKLNLRLSRWFELLCFVRC